MKTSFILIFLTICLLTFSKTKGLATPDKIISDSLKISSEKLKFVILCFKLSPPYDEEISNLNKLAQEFEKYLSPVVIKDDDLSKYKELFTRNEFKSLQDFILNKTEYQKNSTSFPVILILDKNGKIKNAWSGDKTEDGLKKADFYNKIKAGLEAISKQK